MTRLSTAALLASFAVLAACDVTDNNNGSTTIAIDDNKIEAGADAIANEAAKAGDKAADALRNAGPEIEQSASDIKERAGRVADKIENVDVDVDLNLNTAEDKPAPRAN